MGRPRKHPLPGTTQVVTPKAPVLKYSQAARIADKNSRTMMKVGQLLKVVNEPGYAEGDPHRLVEKYIEKLKKRVNKRLYILAKWSDSSPEERQAEFRYRQSSARNFPVQIRAGNYPVPPVPTIGGMYRPPLAPPSGLSLGASFGMHYPLGVVPAMTIGGSAVPTTATNSTLQTPAITVPSTPLPPKVVENPIPPSISQATLASNDSNAAN